MIPLIDFSSILRGLGSSSSMSSSALTLESIFIPGKTGLGLEKSKGPVEASKTGLVSSDDLGSGLPLAELSWSVS